MAEHHALEIALEGLECIAVVGRDVLRRDAGDARDDLLDLLGADDPLLLALRQDALSCAGFVDDVDRFVRQVTVVDEARRQFRSRYQGRLRVTHIVVRLEARLESSQDLHGLIDGWFLDVDLLETTGQRVILLEHAAELGVGGRANTLELTTRKRRFQQIGRVERAARCRTGADQRVDLVDEQNRPRILVELLEHGLESGFEIAAVLGTGK